MKFTCGVFLFLTKAHETATPINCEFVKSFFNFLLFFKFFLKNRMGMDEKSVIDKTEKLMYNV